MYIIKEINLQGCKEVIPTFFIDNRGESIKTFHFSSFNEIGINNVFKEDLLVTSYKNVFRGMHFQMPPFEQAKIVYCIKGRIIDIVLDIRVGSPTYGKYQMVELDGHKKNMLYIPAGFAHGYISLEESIMFYKMSNEYNKGAEGGIRGDSIGLNFDIKEMIISERDKQFVRLEEFESPFIYKE